MRVRDNIMQPGDSVNIRSSSRACWGLDYYLSAAGGFTPAAEKGQVSVRYANGEVRTRRRSLFGSNREPGPGSDVLVPAKDPNAPTTDTLPMAGRIAQILASTGAIIVMATR